MAVYLSPIGNGFQFLGSSLVLLNGGLLNTYAAGTTNAQATFTTNVGNVQNANPIVMNSDGRPANEIWLTGGLSYKFVLTDSLSNTLGTWDNIYGIGDPQAPNAVSGAQLLLNATGGNAITVTANPPPSAYAKGQSWWLYPPTTTTSAVTVNISGLGARSVSKGRVGGLVSLVQNDFIVNNPVLLEDTGAVLVLTNPPAYSQGASITTVSVVNLDTANGDYLSLLGLGTVTSIQLAQGQFGMVVSSTTQAFANSASLIMARNTSITNAPNDVLGFRGEAGGVVRNVIYAPVRALAKAWLQSDSAGNIVVSYGISAVVRNGAGNQTITWDQPFNNANYSLVGTANVPQLGTAATTFIVQINSKTTTSANVVTVRLSDFATIDATNLFVVAYGT